MTLGMRFRIEAIVLGLTHIYKFPASWTQGTSKTEAFILRPKDLTLYYFGTFGRFNPIIWVPNVFTELEGIFTGGGFYLGGLKTSCVGFLGASCWDLRFTY